MPILILLTAAALLLAPARANAQFVPRPYLDWRTTSTPHFDVHYPAEYREWSRAMATHLEAMRQAVDEVVGYVPARRVQLLVDDPINVPNGFALPLLDEPTMVFFPVPPTPRQSIGESRSWGELLAVHEFAHLAHLTRPARRVDYAALLPLPTSPIARYSPRWVIEGYATYVEGRVTGSGRPHSAQRAAVLRQWALEGRLPTYAQLDGASVYNGGAFAYLVGSAYLEWLAAREGDSTLTHLWRRMTARTPRDFPAAFVGVYDDPPEVLYGRFTVAVTGAALAVERAIDSLGGVRAGELVQRLAWETGDPAVSPDGSRLALVLRSRTRPGRVVIWGTAPDTVPAKVAAARDSARARARRRDPLDVPDRRFYPPAKRVLAMLDARDGRAFDTPRFMPDGRQLLVTHQEPIGGGAFRPDVYVWNSATGALRRVTHGAAIRQPDPEPDGRSAVAVRCAHGWCDLVRVDLATGAVRLLREGSPEISYYRPRVSPDGDRIAVAEQRGDRWRILLVDARDPSRVEAPVAGNGNRFDAAWADSGRALVVSSDASGITNLERVDLRTRAVRPITRVTGAALGADVNPRSGEVWFLSLHASGLDVRRLPATADSLILPRGDHAHFPALPAGPRTPPPDLAAGALAPEHPYGIGPRDVRWLPGISRDASGTTGELLLVNGDPVGRLELALLGAAGSITGWRGARGWATLRRWRPELGAELFAATQRPDDEVDVHARDAVDAATWGGGLRTALRTDGSAWRGRLTAGATVMRLDGPAALDGLATRATGWGAIDAAGWRRLLATDLAGAIRVQGDAGRHATLDVAHLTTTLAVRIAPPLLPAIGASIMHATLREGTTDAPFERITVGGGAPVLLDPVQLPQRIAMPALPVGALVGSRATVARATLGGAALSPYYWTARVDDDPFGGWQRVAGIETRVATDAIPLVSLPAAELTGGVGYSIDRPWKGRTTLYLSATYRP